MQMYLSEMPFFKVLWIVDVELKVTGEALM